MIGIAIGMFSVVASAALSESPTATTTIEGQSARLPSLIWPLAVAGIAVLVGGAMMAYGGRGYTTTMDPNVRN